MAVLKVTTRDELGTRKVRRLRKQGKIPGIIYGHGEKPVCVALNQHEVALAIGHGERLLELKLGAKTHNVLIKDVQYDTFGQEILHMDLTRVNLDERVEVTVPIVLRGTPVGVESEDGVLNQRATEANVECLARSIPEEIRVTVNDLHVGDSLHIKDLPLPEGATLLDDADALVCSVNVVTEVEEAPAEAEEEETAAEPEVIGEKPEQAEGEAAGEEKEK
ncbi:MAG: 50S ribosomal protein L25 [Planctomycetota bacterium]|nr:50S ribosomal protein L25 [Planctomycetota bacterium]